MSWLDIGVVFRGYTVKINKKPIAFIIVLVMALAFMFATTAHAAAFYSDIRVLLSTASKSVHITLIGEYYIKEDPEFQLSAEKMTVSIVGSRPVLTSGTDTFTASSITLVSRDYDGTSSYIRLKNSKYGTCTYLGNLTFNVREGKLRVINTLPIERYLYGVVPYEMSNTFPIESLKAQAVGARGYAVANCSKYRLRDYDILDTSADQVYHGYATKYTRAIAAVDETAGQVLTYEGEIIQAYYAASNGGQTELTGNVWASDLPYYVQRDDIYDVQNPWSLEEKSFIPSQFSPQTLPLMDGIVLEMLQAGANAAAGRAATLLSTVRVRAYEPRYGQTSRSYTKADVILMASFEDGGTGQLTVTLPLDGLLYKDDNPGGIFNASGRTLRMRGAEQGTYKTDDGKEYEGWFLTNRRYGHGIGLSQRGAQQRATSGQNYGEILDFYYADTQLYTIGTFDTAPALTSEKFAVSKGFISGIEPGTSPGELLSGLSSDGGTLSVITSGGKQKTGGRVSTGNFVRTVYGEGLSFFDIAAVVYGDADGDGSITQEDLEALRQHIMNLNSLTGVYLEAADVNRDGNADSLDVLLLLKHIHGAHTIEQRG